MKVTGERYIPKHMSLDGEIEHYHRYYSALPFVKEKIVLDAACGTGYGSKILSGKAAKVYGLDLNEEAIEYAEQNYKAENVVFQVGNISELPYPDHFFDAVVSYETIEHVDQAIQRLFLEEIKRVLKPGGILIISTPNKKEFTDERKLITPFHIKEFYEDEFVDFLKKRFNHVRIFNQYYAKTSQMISDRAQKARLINFDLFRKGFFFVALASDEEICNIEDFESIYHYPEDYLRRSAMLQIYYQNNGKFDENDTENVQIDPLPGVVSESIQLSDVHTRSIRVDPMNMACCIRVENIAVCLSNGTLLTNLPFIHNADIVEGERLTFLHNDPQLLIDFSDEKDILSITVQFTVFPLDENLLYCTYRNSKATLEETISQERKEHNALIEQANKALEEVSERMARIQKELEDTRKEHSAWVEQANKALEEVSERMARTQKELEDTKRLLMTIKMSRGWSLYSRINRLPEIHD